MGAVTAFRGEGQPKGAGPYKTGRGCLKPEARLKKSKTGGGKLGWGSAEVGGKRKDEKTA